MYPYLAGGPMQNLVAAPSAAVTINLTNFCSSNLSLYPLGAPQMVAPVPPAQDTAITSIRRSGKLVHYGAGGAVAFLQPCFDTWTDTYESDGFDQTSDRTGVIGSYPKRYGSVWVLYNAVGTGMGRDARWPRPAPPATSAPPAPFSIDSGRYDPTEPESLPPFLAPLPAISVSVRVLDPETGQFEEITIVQEMLDDTFKK
jgi:hypothetical protein